MSLSSCLWCLLSLLHLLHVAYVPFNIPPSASPSSPCLCLTLCCSQRPPVSQAAKGTPLPSLQRVHDLQTQNPLLQEPKARGKSCPNPVSRVGSGCMVCSAYLVLFVNEFIVFSHPGKQSGPVTQDRQLERGGREEEGGRVAGRSHPAQFFLSSVHSRSTFLHFPFKTLRSLIFYPDFTKKGKLKIQFLKLAPCEMRNYNSLCSRDIFP